MSDLKNYQDDLNKKLYQLLIDITTNLEIPSIKYEEIRNDDLILVQEKTSLVIGLIHKSDISNFDKKVREIKTLSQGYRKIIPISKDAPLYFLGRIKDIGSVTSNEELATAILEKFHKWIKLGSLPKKMIVDEILYPEDINQRDNYLRANYEKGIVEILSGIILLHPDNVEKHPTDVIYLYDDSVERIRFFNEKIKA